MKNQQLAAIFCALPETEAARAQALAAFKNGVDIDGAVRLLLPVIFLFLRARNVAVESWPLAAEVLDIEIEKAISARGEK